MSGGGEMGLNHSAALQADFRFLVACFAHPGLRPVQRTEYQLILCARYLDNAQFLAQILGPELQDRIVQKRL